MSGIRSYLKYLSISSSRAAFNFPNLFCASNFNLSQDLEKSSNAFKSSNCGIAIFIFRKFPCVNTNTATQLHFLV